ncbi:MAG TPA: Spy/CpxP family protein refolding chaperone [Gemmatimonadaceae bacterium]|nr:Spy/CpxP family protein refolding chaperone [Gemmatimonadaceae bacterium]
MSQFRSTLIAALVALGGAAVAGAQAPTQTPAQVPQQHARAGKGHRGKFAKRGDRQLFKNIKLSDAEKANVKAVRQKYAPQMKALRAQFKPQIEQARQARQRGDTAAMKNLWAQSSAQRGQAKKLRDAERNDLRNALSPDNRAKFDANVTKVEQRVAQRAAKGGRKG